MSATVPTQRWIFRARIVNIVDGDTVDLEVDCGMHARRVERMRVLHVDAPETRGVVDRAPGLAAKQFVADWWAEVSGEGGFPLVVQTIKTDSFGRYLADIWRDVDGANLSADLLSSGNALPYEGGTR